MAWLRGNDQSQRLAANVDAILWEVDRAGRMTAVNEYAQRLFGSVPATLDEMLHLTGDGFIDKLFAEGSATTLAHVTAADGRPVWLHVRGHAAPGGAGACGVAQDVSELHEAERRLREVFDIADMMAAITAADGRIVYINQALAATSGRTPDQLIGRDWVEELCADDEDRAVVRHFFSELAEGRVVAQDENLIETPDGDVRRIAWINTILRNPDGSVFGAASIGNDVTDQRAAEEALRTSEERFRMLSENAPVGIFMTDASGGCKYVNECWLQLSGLTADQVMGRGWGNAIHPDDREAMAARWASVRERGDSLSEEVRLQRPDGEVLCVHAMAVPLHDAEGRMTGYIGTTADITERSRAEAAVVESERRLRTVTDNMADVIFVYGMDHRLEWVTPSVERLTGYTTAELFEQNTLDDVHPDDEARMLERWRALFDGVEYTGAEFRIINRDGTEKWCWSAGSPIHDANGTQIGVQIRPMRTSRCEAGRAAAARERAAVGAIIEHDQRRLPFGRRGGRDPRSGTVRPRTFGVSREQAIGRSLFSS